MSSNSQDIAVTCPDCHASGKVPEAYAGKNIRCHKCGHGFSAPEATYIQQSSSSANSSTASHAVNSASRIPRMVTGDECNKFQFIAYGNNHDIRYQYSFNNFLSIVTSKPNYIFITMSRRVKNTSTQKYQPVISKYIFEDHFGYHSLVSGSNQGAVGAYYVKLFHDKLCGKDTSDIDRNLSFTYDNITTSIPSAVVTTPKQKTVIGYIICILIIGLIAYGIFAQPHNEPHSSNSNRSNTTIQDRVSDEKIGAYSYAELYVRERLNSQRSIKFPWYSENYVTELGGGKYRVDAYVDSDNNFGVSIRTYFTCELETNDGDSWRLIDLNFTE